MTRDKFSSSTINGKTIKNRFIRSAVNDHLGNLHFPDEESDRQIVKEALESGQFAVHHSRRYNAAYSRHYRIIRFDIAEKLMH